MAWSKRAKARARGKRPVYIDLSAGLVAALSVPQRYGMSERSRLQRLKSVWEKQPVYFITTCVAGCRPLLAKDATATVLRSEWVNLRERYGWAVGSYVIMPDHVHFFVTAECTTVVSLSGAIGKWKEWSAKRILKEQCLDGALWQPTFFDHLLRSVESRSEKWAYVREIPVRQGLVERAEDWKYSGWIDFE